MEVHLKNGTVLHGQTMAAKGSFENPLTLEEELEKAIDLTAPIIGKNKSLELFKVLCNIENVKNVQILRSLYSK